MTQVVDASVVVAALIDDSAEGRWCEERVDDGSLFAPHLMAIEATNILRRSETAGLIDPTEAAAALDDLRRLDVDLVEFTDLMDRTWALRSNITTYDACYVATAELVGVRLVTLDRRLARAPGPRCEVVVPPESLAQDEG